MMRLFDTLEQDTVMRRKKSFLLCILWGSWGIWPSWSIFLIICARSLCWWLVCCWLKGLFWIRLLLSLLYKGTIFLTWMNLINFSILEIIRNFKKIFKMMPKSIKPFLSKWGRNSKKKSAIWSSKRPFCSTKTLSIIKLGSWILLCWSILNNFWMKICITLFLVMLRHRIN